MGQGRLALRVEHAWEGWAGRQPSSDGGWAPGGFPLTVQAGAKELLTLQVSKGRDLRTETLPYLSVLIEQARNEVGHRGQCGCSGGRTYIWEQK